VDGDMAVDVVGPASQQEHQRVSLSGIAGLPPLTGAGPHKLTVDTAPARFTPEVFEVSRVCGPPRVVLQSSRVWYDSRELQIPCSSTESIKLPSTATRLKTAQNRSSQGEDC
jgi:hypothetical protein